MQYDLKKSLLLYAVTDRRWLKENQSLSDAVKEAVNGGATMIQLREKNMSDDELKKEALLIKDSCNVPLIIDNNIEVCKAVGADGVHVGQDDMPVKEARAILGDDYVIGATAHNVSEAIQAEKDGADYLGVGAAFGSSTKNDAKKIISLEEYKKITQAVSIPVVAIGGINETNIMKLKGLGLSGVAVVSAIFAKDDIEKATREMLNMALSEFE
ncbi:MAG: thiamine phosphate synthase [Lachnospiraceae bacterium]|nr:thiamine phosphate synthase [Lachnospiraceae bacterium]MDD7326405.1 thiamine phosphate synthase [Lachnospiraceae bacterium]MDY2759151.1 thiamine phosphate synthase [Lachnospiraceae bacterium]